MKWFFSSLTRKLVAACVGLSLLIILVFGIWFQKVYRDRILSEIHNQVESAASLLASNLKVGLNSISDETIKKMVKDWGALSNERITLIDVKGRVIADSMENPSQMENHLNRPEVLQAIATGHGESFIYSDTFHLPMMYFARAVKVDGTIQGVIRAAIPTSRVDQGVREIQKMMGLSSLLVLFFTLLVSLWLIRHVASPIEHLLEMVQQMKHGNSKKRIQKITNDEMGRLGNEMNQMADQLFDRTRALEEAKEKLDLALSALRGGVLTLNQKGQLVFWNESAYQFLEWNVFPEQKKSLEDLVRIPALLDIARVVREKGEGESGEFVIRKNGSEKMIFCHGFPCQVEETKGAMLVFQDVTDMRFLERARRDFVMNASHELKTPLTAIKGYVGSLADGAWGDPSLRERFFAQLSTNVDRLATLADDLLALSRIESQRDEIQLHSISCLSIVQETIQRYQPLAEKKGLKFSFSGAVNAKGMTHGPSLLRILDNLVDNAVKYTPSGGFVQVQMNETARSISIAVEDSGVGIPKEDLSRIFERFYRVDKARSLAAGGTGLGLSIVKDLVDLTKASIWVESELGQGSRFIIEIPRSL